MPTLNYENIDAVISYDYLQGVIQQIYPEDDTADVSGACGALSAVPIFYHCFDGAVQKDNGAIEGAAGGFAVGDPVVVLVGRDADANSLGKRYYIVGHYDGVRSCGMQGIIWVDSYSGFWNYGYGTSREILRRFAWDPATNDYATDVLITDIGGDRLIEKSEWPIGVGNGVFGRSVEQRYGSLTLKPTFVAEAEGVVVLSTTDFNQLKVAVGDYVWQTNNPGVWANVTFVSGPLFKTSRTVVLSIMVGTANHDGFTVSSSIPSYYLYEYETEEFIWTYQGSYYIDLGLFNSYWVYIYTASEKTVTTTNVITGDSAISTRACTAVKHQRDNGSVIWLLSLNHDVIVKYKSPFSDEIFSRTYNIVKDYNYDVPTGTNVTLVDSESGSHDFLAETAWSMTETRPGGVSVFTGDTFLSNSQNYGYEDETDPIWVLYNQNIDRYHNAMCNNLFSWEHHVYKGYARNIRAQCTRRSGSTPSSNRSSALENAIKRLIDVTVELDKDIFGDPLEMVGVYMKYYSETRLVAGPFNMLNIINGVRGYSKLLEEDPVMMAECQEKIAFFLSNFCCQHEGPGGLPSAEECIAITTYYAWSAVNEPAEVVVGGWMASPHHAEIIMKPEHEIIGWAAGVYPTDMPYITYGAGMFDSRTGTYTSEPVTIDLTGITVQLKCWVLQMKAKD